MGEPARRAIEQLPLDHTLEGRRGYSSNHLATLAPSLEVMAAPGWHAKLQWSSDASIDRGGFVVETPHRIIDAQPDDVALRTLYEKLDHE